MLKKYEGKLKDMLKKKKDKTGYTGGGKKN